MEALTRMSQGFVHRHCPLQRFPHMIRYSPHCIVWITPEHRSLPCLFATMMTTGGAPHSRTFMNWREVCVVASLWACVSTVACCSDLDRQTSALHSTTCIEDSKCSQYWQCHWVAANRLGYDEQAFNRRCDPNSALRHAHAPGVAHAWNL